MGFSPKGCDPDGLQPFFLAKHGENACLCASIGLYFVQSTLPRNHENREKIRLNSARFFRVFRGSSSALRLCGIRLTGEAMAKINLYDRAMKILSSLYSELALKPLFPDRVIEVLDRQWRKKIARSRTGTRWMAC